MSWYLPKCHSGAVRAAGQMNMSLSNGRKDVEKNIQWNVSVHYVCIHGERIDVVAIAVYFSTLVLLQQSTNF